jgi:hypothetical protein
MGLILKFEDMKQSILTLLVILGAVAVFGQQGIFYFKSDNNMLPNSRVLDITETQDGNLLLLTKNSDKDYKDPRAGLIAVNNDGSQGYFNVIEEMSFYDINSISVLPNNNYKISGNFSLNQIFRPQHLIVDAKGRLIDTHAESAVYSTHLEDIVQVNENEALALMTKNSKVELFNINLHYVSLLDNKVKWIKKISSEMNEEANQIIIANNGDYLVLGKKYNEDMSDYVPIIYRLNAKGELLWKKGVIVPSNFYVQRLANGRDGEIIYSCGYTNNPTGFAETRMIKFNSKGDQISTTVLEDFSINGVLELEDNKYCLYGSKFDVDKKQVVTRAKYVIVDYSLKAVKSDFLSTNDKPDIDAGSKKTTSDFICGKVLPDGRIALGGRVFMPKTKKEMATLDNALLVILAPNGNMR